MDHTSKLNSLFNDRVRKFSENIPIAVAASSVNAVILAVVCRNVVGFRSLVLWTGGVIAISLVRLYLRNYYRKIEKNNHSIKRFRNVFLITLFISGMIWGSAALLLLPRDFLGYQVFIAFVLGGMVAGTVGTYSAMMSAFFAFSIPALLPIVIRFFLADEQIYYAMGSMVLLYWVIMLMTALRLNRDIVNYLLVSYENLDLIADLEAEVKVREAAESDLRQKNLEIEGIVDRRTEELLESNKKLIRQIEERRLIADALKENEEKYRDLVENINDVIFSADETGIVTYVSPVIRTVLGYNPEELVGKNFRDFLHEDDLPILLAAFPERLAGKVGSVDYRFRAKTNEYRWVRSSSRAVFKEGRVVGIKGALTDISEKVKLEEQLRRSQKMEAIGTLSGGIAHDFNNLLAVIMGNSELCLFSLPEKLPARNYLEKIIATTLRAKAIVKELLSFARQTGGERKPISIKAAVQDELEYIKPSMPASITMETEIDCEIETILGDTTQIGQVLRNLCDNAVDAMSDTGGTLTVGLHNVGLSPDDIDFDPDLTAGTYIRLTVRDTGVGISPRNVRRVFDPYYTTKDVGKGDGLGLAVL